MSSSHINTLKRNWLLGWNELTKKSLVDLEQEWLEAEVTRDKETNSRDRLQLHYEFMREYLGLNEPPVTNSTSYNSLLHAFLNEQGYSTYKSKQSNEREYFEDVASLGFQALSPRLDGTIDIEPQRGTGSATFTRADGATDIAHVRDFENLYKKVPAGEARFQGACRVRNLLAYSEDFSDALWTAPSTTTLTTGIQDKDGGNNAVTVKATSANQNLRQNDINSRITVGDTWTISLWIKRRTGTGTVDLWDGNNYIPLELSNSWQRFSVTASIAATVSFILRVTTALDEVDVCFPQVEQVDGQTNQAPSEYVPTEASAVTKYFYTENNNEIAENQLLQSRQFDTTWISSSLDALTQDETGYDGQANKAWTGTGSSTLDVVYQDVTIPADTRDYVFSLYIKKDSDETRFPQIYLALFTGGTQVDEAVYFNTKTGDINNLSGRADGTTLVEDRGDWWKVSCSLTNSNNTVARCHYYPSYSSSFTSDVSVAGSSIFDQAQLSFDTSEATETQVETTTTAITNVVGTKTAQWEQVDNNLTYSYDLTQWSLSGTDVADLNEVGIYGESNTATTLTDNDGAVYENMATQITVTDDANWHVYSVIVKKDNTPASTRLVGIDINLTGGTTQRNLQGLDTSTGELTSGQETGSVFSYSESFNDNWWKVSVAVKNNSSGNTTCLVRAYPAIGNSGTPVTSAATGSCIIGHAQLSLNRVTPYTGLVTTTGSAITLGKEKSLDKYLHPTTYKSGAKVFKKFNKWITATAYSVGDYIIPATGSGSAGGNGYYYQCVVAGTTGGSEPTFGTTIGDGTYDNGVVWKCMGKATVAGYFSEPLRTNSITDSYNLTSGSWAVAGTPIRTVNQTGIDGVANHATYLEDDDVAVQEYVNHPITIVDDGNSHAAQFWIKKDSDTSRYVELLFRCDGGTASVWNIQHLDTQNGTLVENGSSGANTEWVEDHGDWWRVVLTITNNGTGNTNAAARISPAAGTVQGTRSVAATGSCIAGHVQVELNTSVPSSPILTTGAADTRDVDNLRYNDSNYSDSQGTLLATYGFISSDDPGTSKPIVGTRIGTNSGQLYYTGAGIGTYDGTTVAVKGSVPFTKENPEISISGSRWGGSVMAVTHTGLSEASAVYDGSYTNNLSAIAVGLNGSLDIPLIVSDVLIYNKDLGTTKLESMTAYD